MSGPGEGAPAKGAPAPAARAVGLAVAVVASRFNGAYVERLLAGALAALEELGLARERVAVYRCPGAFELPLLAREVARARRPDCIVALGAVIRGETPHFDFVAGEAARGAVEMVHALAEVRRHAPDRG